MFGGFNRFIPYIFARSASYPIKMQVLSHVPLLLQKKNKPFMVGYNPMIIRS